MAAQPLVTIGLPVYNGAETVANVIDSVLRQSYPDIELLISDNASTDGTQDVCRQRAAEDSRIRYHRHPENIGLVSNFMWTKDAARGAFFRWIGDDDEISPEYVRRSLDVYAEDDRLVLVTSQLAYTSADGTTLSSLYGGSAMRSPDAIDRFAEMLRLLTDSHLVLDPMYGLIRRAAVAGIHHDRVLRGDEIYAAKLALAGPWGHVPEVLGHRHWDHVPYGRLIDLLGAPRWNAGAATAVQCRLLMSALDRPGLSEAQRRRGRAEVLRFYLRRHGRTAARRGRKLARMGAELARPAARDAG